MIGVCATAALTACDENSWNNDYLDGFEEPEISNVQTITKDLTAADYTAIAKLKANIAIAQKLDAENGGGDKYLNALAAVKNGYFSDLATAKDYLPAFLDSLQTNNNAGLIGLSNGSRMKVNYATTANLPEVVAGIAGAVEYTFTEDDYSEYIWEGEDDWVDAVTPSHPVNKYITRILSDAIGKTEGQYAIVTYNVAQQDPNFGGSTTPEPQPFTMSSVLGSAKAGDMIDVAGVIMAVGNQGFFVKDATGEMAVYIGTSFQYKSYNVGDQVKFSANVAYRSSNSYNQLTLVSGTEIEVAGHQDVTYPAPLAISGADLDARIAQMVTADYVTEPVYATITGTLNAALASSGTYYNLNINVPGATTAVGSILWGSTELTEKLLPFNGKEITITGYLVSKSSTKYVNFIITELNGSTITPASAKVDSRAGSISFASEPVTKVYTYSGGAWVVPSNVTMLTDADYALMGVSDLNATNINFYLPIYLNATFPYAQADDVEYVVYRFYDSVNKKTIYNCSECTFNGSEWIFSAYHTESGQFILNNYKWVYDPSVTIDLPAGRNLEPSMSFFQACVDYVYETVDVPQFGATSITSGVGYVTSYGTNEYYAGTSAYQGNVDLRAASARKQCPTGWDGYTDDEIVATMKHRFESEVCPAALSKLYPDAAPIAGIELFYTVNFAAYTGSTSNYSAIYKVTGKAQFEFVSCTWNSAE